MFQYANHRAFISNYKFILPQNSSFERYKKSLGFVINKSESI